MLWLLKVSLPLSCNVKKQNKTLVIFLVMGRHSQLEVQKNLNLFLCMNIFTFNRVFFSPWVMSMHPCVLSFHTSLMLSGFCK